MRRQLTQLGRGRARTRIWGLGLPTSDPWPCPRRPHSLIPRTFFPASSPLGRDLGIFRLPSVPGSLHLGPNLCVWLLVTCLKEERRTGLRAAPTSNCPSCLAPSHSLALGLPGPQKPHSPCASIAGTLRTPKLREASPTTHSQGVPPQADTGVH